MQKGRRVTGCLNVKAFTLIEFWLLLSLSAFWRRWRCRNTNDLGLNYANRKPAQARFTSPADQEFVITVFGNLPFAPKIILPLWFVRRLILRRDVAAFGYA